MPQNRFVVAMLVTFLLAPGIASAQQARTTGFDLAAAASMIEIAEPRDPHSPQLPLEAAWASERGLTWMGAGIGALLGGLAGFALYEASDPVIFDGCMFGCSIPAVASIALGGFMGGTAGAIIGGVLSAAPADGQVGAPARSGTNR